MALLRSGCRTNESSGSSSASFQSCEMPRCAGPELTPTTDGLIIHNRKRVRKALSTDGCAEVGTTCFPTAGELLKKSDEELKKILLEGMSKVRCPRCNALASLSPVGKAGPASTCRWKCGARVGEPGCKMTCAQVVVFARALGAGKSRSWASIAPRKLTKRINLLMIRSSQETVQNPSAAKPRKEESR